MENNKMDIYGKLSLIQNELNAPKNLWNDFGKYYYRNLETILESVKPILKKYSTILLIQDEIVFVEGRFYVKANVILKDLESSDSIKISAFAREEESKRGMDASQVTGSCSSYARKYALNALFNIDDVKDADSNEQTQERNERAKKTSEPKETSEPKKASSKQLELIKQLYNLNEINQMLNNLNKDIYSLTSVEADKMIKARKK